LVFDNVANAESTYGRASQAQAIADQMSEAWLAFTRSGNPGTPQLPEWPAYDPLKRPTLIRSAEIGDRRSDGNAHCDTPRCTLLGYDEIAGIRTGATQTGPAKSGRIAAFEVTATEQVI
jgi:hypothetical protein